jgi:hypothetical protein
MAVDTYYFDASIAGPTDPNSKWTDDANAFDGEIGILDSAFTQTAGSTSSNFLRGDGTTAPTSGDEITQVRARLNGGSNIVGPDHVARSAIYTESLGELLGTPNIANPQGWSDYVVLSTPSGGWTWDKLNKLVVKCYGTNAEGVPTWRVRRVEIEVTYLETQEASPDAIPSTLAFGTLVGGQGASVEGIPSTASFGTPGITGIATVSPDAIPSTLAFGDPFAHIPRNSATVYTRSSKPDTAYTKSAKPKTEHTKDSP